MNGTQTLRGLTTVSFWAADLEIERAPYDTEFTEPAVRGLLGLPPQATPTEKEIHE